MDLNTAGVPALMKGSPGLVSELPEMDSAATGSLCMNCRVRSACIGGVAAAAGTTQLRSVLLGRRRLKPGEAIYREDEHFTVLYAVRSGSLKSAARRGDGEQVLGFHLPGEVVGVDGIAHARHAATVTALEDTDLCAIRYGAYEPTQPGARAFFGKLWDMMSTQLVQERTHAALLAGLNANQRVSAFLVTMSARMRARGYSSREFHLRMSRAEIGSYLGVTMETVSRTLSALARRGVVEVQRKYVRILDPEALQVEAEAE